MFFSLLTHFSKLVCVNICKWAALSLYVVWHRAAIHVLSDIIRVSKQLVNTGNIKYRRFVSLCCMSYTLRKCFWHVNTPYSVINRKNMYTSRKNGWDLPLSHANLFRNLPLSLALENTHTATGELQLRVTNQFQPSTFLNKALLKEGHRAHETCMARCAEVCVKLSLGPDAAFNAYFILHKLLLKSRLRAASAALNWQPHLRHVNNAL